MLQFVFKLKEYILKQCHGKVSDRRSKLCKKHRKLEPNDSKQTDWVVNQKR